jgi:hypothetical protein
MPNRQAHLRQDRPRDATLIHVNDVRGHAAVLALFDEVIAAA